MVRPFGPFGLGFYVAFPFTGAKEARGYVQAYCSIIDRCVELGAHWIAPRLGNGEGFELDRSDFADICQYATERGREVYPWIYSKPRLYQEEVEVFARAVGRGAHGCIINAEVPWGSNLEPRCQDMAASYVHRLRQAVPNSWIAHCPYAYVLWHPEFPYSGFSDVDDVWVQTYWTEFNQKSAAHHLAAVDGQWQRVGPEYKGRSGVVNQIGVTYGDDWASGQRPPGKITAKDVSDYIAHQRLAQLPTAFYSYEAMKNADVVATIQQEFEIDPQLPLKNLTLPPEGST